MLVEPAGAFDTMPTLPTAMRWFARPLLGAVAVLLLAAGVPRTADARPYGYYPGHGGGWGGAYRPGWGVGYRPGWGYRAPYYGYGYGYGFGFGLATGAALGWSMAGPWWPASYWGGVGYAYPSAYYPYAGVAVAVPAAPVEQVYIEQPQASRAEAAPQPSAGHWYYCSSPAGYYPDVNTCSRPWIAVDPHTGRRAGGAPGQ